MTRRGFTKSLVMVSFASFAASGVLAAMQGLIRARGPLVLPEAPLSEAEAVPVGGVRLFKYPDEDHACLLVRLDRDHFEAFSQKCTHLGCPVVFEPDKFRFRCPCHEGLFSAVDGSVLQGPPQRPLPRIQLEMRGQDLWATSVSS